MGLLRMATRTAVVAGTATAVSGRVARRQANKYDQQQQQQYAPQQQQYAPAPVAPAPPPPAAAPPEDDLNTKLQQLAALHGQGVLTDEEFSSAKAKLLGI
jgi:hemolysin activation/secretion protein